MPVRLLLACVLAFCWAVADSNPPGLPFELEASWLKLPTGWNLHETPGVAAGPQQHVYIFHRGDHPIIEVDRDGRVVRSMGEGLFGAAHGMEVDSEGNIWVTDRGDHTVLKMSSVGRVLMVMGRKGQAAEGEDNFDGPTDIAFAANGDFYVSDGYGNSRVAKFTKDGEFITAWGKAGKAPGEFNLPHAVAVDADGKVYVGDRENYRLQVFDADGKFLEAWDHVGSPWGLHITPGQEIFMADGHNNRVLKLDRSGKILGALGKKGKLPGQFNYAHHLAVDLLGNLYVAEIKNWRVQKFRPR
jgi:DNA-binding beta-propeller fold protein YncE